MSDFKDKTDTTVISFKSDYLFFPKEMEHIYNMMMRNKQRVKYYEVDSNYGHDAFLLSWISLIDLLEKS